MPGNGTAKKNWMSSIPVGIFSYRSSYLNSFLFRISFVVSMVWNVPCPSAPLCCDSLSHCLSMFSWAEPGRAHLSGSQPFSSCSWAAPGDRGQLWPGLVRAGARSCGCGTTCNTECYCPGWGRKLPLLCQCGRRGHQVSRKIRVFQKNLIWLYFRG